jgi:hypothetical protein|tara:strand:+ start:5020 stop:5415 length:396 start_codon:yes stop_codon:yes gene_type:complete
MSENKLDPDVVWIRELCNLNIFSEVLAKEFQRVADRLEKYVEEEEEETPTVDVSSMISTVLQVRDDDPQKIRRLYTGGRLDWIVDFIYSMEKLVPNPERISVKQETSLTELYERLTAEEPELAQVIERWRE